MKNTTILLIQGVILLNPTAKIFIKTNDIYSLNSGDEIDGLAYLPEEHPKDYIELTVPI